MAISPSVLPHNVTIFNRIGEVSGAAFYQPTFFTNVRLETRLAATPVKEGLRASDSFRLFIDAQNSRAFYFDAEGRTIGREYASGDFWSLITDEAKRNYWTLREGDYIVPQVTDFEIPPHTIAELKKKHIVFTVNATVPVYARRNIHHWEVYGRGRILE